MLPLVGVRAPSLDIVVPRLARDENRFCECAEYQDRFELHATWAASALSDFNAFTATD